MRSFVLVLVGICFSLGGVAPAVACDNFVGGVCLDKKKAPAKKPVKKSKSKKKATTKKKVVVQEPKVVVPKKASANKCVKITSGKASSVDFYKDVVYTNLTFKNTCKEKVTVYLRLNGCASPKAYFNPMVGKGTKKFKLRSGGRVSYSIAHQEGLRGVGRLGRINAAYAGQSANFPAFGC